MLCPYFICAKSNQDFLTAISLSADWRLYNVDSLGDVCCGETSSTPVAALRNERASNGGLSLGRSPGKHVWPCCHSIRPLNGRLGHAPTASTRGVTQSQSGNCSPCRIPSGRDNVTVNRNATAASSCALSSHMADHSARHRRRAFEGMRLSIEHPLVQAD